MMTTSAVGDRGIHPRGGAAAARRRGAGLAPPPAPELMDIKQRTGIAAGEYKRRRRQLMDMAGEDAILVLPAAAEVRSLDTHYPFRRDSVSVPERLPGAGSGAGADSGRRHGEAILFCRERDAEREAWDGSRAGQEGAVAQYGMDDAYPIDDLDDILPGLLEGRSRVYYHFGRDADFDLKLIGWSTACVRRYATVRSRHMSSWSWATCARAASVQVRRRSGTDAPRRTDQRACASGGDEGRQGRHPRVRTAGRAGTRVPRQRWCPRTAASSAPAAMLASCITATTTRGRAMASC